MSVIYPADIVSPQESTIGFGDKKIGTVPIYQPKEAVNASTNLKKVLDLESRVKTLENA